MSLHFEANPKQNLAQVLETFEADLALNEAKTPPASWYLREDVFDLERTAVFATTWQWVTTRDRLRHPGDFLTGQFFDWPYVVVVDAKGELGAYFNVCRHHGTCVAKGQGKTDKLVCPYHGWTYDLSGKLIKAPNAGASRFLRAKDFGLIPIPLLTAGRFIGLGFGQEKATPAPVHQAQIASLDDSKYRFVARRSYDMACNWKVFIDNYLDGGYHVPFMHPDLAADLDMKHYRSELLDRAVMQSCHAKADVSQQDRQARVKEKAHYLWVYPNFCLNQYGNWLDTNFVIPTGPDTCRVVFEYFHDGPIGEHHLEAALKDSDQVQQEDMAICDMVQTGLRSGVYHQGIYAPKFEAPMYRFHRWLSHDLRNGLAKSSP